jgi:hypothetical protein
MNLPGAPAVLAAVSSVQAFNGDSTTDSGMRTLTGLAAMLVVLLVVIGIGVMMTGSTKS